MRLSAQVAAGGAWQLLGGLQAALLSGGVRAVVGPRHGRASRYAFGLGLDFEQQSAVSGGALPARWDVSETRVRLEGEARLVERTLGPVDVDLSVVAGLGAILGGHSFQIGDARASALLLGPTGRLALVSGLGVGPGAVTLTLPLDVSVDTAGGTNGFAPIAAGLYVGYRLDL